MPYRPLLCADAGRLSRRQRMQRIGVRWILALPDRRYEAAFKRLEARLNLGWSPSGRTNRNSILLTIGSLGAGGAERQLVGTLKALKARGYRNVGAACTYLSTPQQRFFLPELQAAGIAVSVIGAKCDQFIDPELRAMIEELPEELCDVKNYVATFLAEHPQIVHLWLDEVNCKGGIAAVLTKVPRIILSQRNVTPDNFGFHQPYMREAYRWLARAPGVAMINNSAAGARAYERWLRMPEGTISVVHNGFVFDETRVMEYRAARGSYLRRYGIADGVPVIGTVSRLSEEKRPFLWLSVAAEVRRLLPDAHFLVVGDGPLRAALESRAGELGLAGAMHFAGNEKDVYNAMIDMDLLVLMSRAEGLPNVLVEAQFLGVPVVTTRVGGAPETVDHGRSGWVLEGDDCRACAVRIVALLKDPTWLAAASRHAMAFARARFGMGRAIEETLTVYGTLAHAVEVAAGKLS